MSTSAQFTQTFNSFSGVDMLVTFAGKLIGEVQGLSYTVTREKAPLYTMGSANPRSFSRGKRGIAGSMVFLQFDRSALIDAIGALPRSWFVGNAYETRKGFVGGEIKTADGQSVGGTVGSGEVAQGNLNVVTTNKVMALPQYPDQIMPFNVSITAANEYGHVASMHILGVEILNMGSGMSVDDITIDESCTFVCTDIIPWDNQKFIRKGRIEDVSRRMDSPPAGGGVI